MRKDNTFKAAALLTSPFRLAAWLLLLSLLAWMPPWNLLSHTWGQLIVSLLFIKDLTESLARTAFVPGRLTSRDGIPVWLTVQAPIVATVLERAWLSPDAGCQAWMCWLGAAISLSGIVLRAWAMKTLGRFFTLTLQVHADHELVASGPYRILRHPSYTGAMLFLLGASIAVSSIAGTAAVFLVTLPGVIYRMSREELALRRKLGAKYRNYMKNTKRLVPFLY